MVFSNFVQFPLPIGGNGAGAPLVGSQKTAGALGRGLQASSGVNLSFKFLSYTLPILGGWVADTKWGRYKTVCVSIQSSRPTNTLALIVVVGLGWCCHLWCQPVLH